MSEQIKLRVPSKPAAEFVSHGNHSATLTPKGVITVTDRRFADFLVNDYACAEVDAEPVGSGQEAEGSQQEQDAGGSPAVQSDNKTAGGKK